MADKQKSGMQEALTAFLDQAAGQRPASPVAPVRAAPTANPATGPVGASKAPTGPGGKDDLLAAFDRLVEHEATKPRSVALVGGRRWKTYLVPGIGIAAVTSMLYLWIGRPGWLYPSVEPIGPPTTLLQAQQSLAATSILVEQYKSEHGRYPVDLKELGLGIGWMSLGPDVTGGFRVIGGTPNRPLLLRSVPGITPKIEAFPR